MAGAGGRRMCMLVGAARGKQAALAAWARRRRACSPCGRRGPLGPAQQQRPLPPHDCALEQPGPKLRTNGSKVDCARVRGPHPVDDGQTLSDEVQLLGVVHQPHRRHLRLGIFYTPLRLGRRAPQIDAVELPEDLVCRDRGFEFGPLGGIEALVVRAAVGVDAGLDHVDGRRRRRLQLARCGAVGVAVTAPRGGRRGAARAARAGGVLLLRRRRQTPAAGGRGGTHGGVRLPAACAALAAAPLVCLCHRARARRGRARCRRRAAARARCQRTGMACHQAAWRHCLGPHLIYASRHLASTDGLHAFPTQIWACRLMPIDAPTTRSTATCKCANVA